MSAPYIKTGRGGAGNMFSPEELRKKEQEDLEAQESSKLANEVAAEQAVQQSAGDGSEYKHMGRGGAGNWYTPGTLTKEGVFTDTTTTSGSTVDPTSVNPSHANHQIDPRPWRGRGGAGNFAPDKPVEPERIELEERLAAQEVQEEVRRDVEAGLRKPESAYLGNGGVGPRE